MTAPVVCSSKTINLVHYQWLFKEGCDAVDEKCMLLLLWYSCQACKSWISFRRLARIQLLWCSEYCDEATIPPQFAVLRGWRDSTQNMTTWYCITGRKRYTVVVPLCGTQTLLYISISNRPKTSKNMHMQGWIQRDLTTDEKEEEERRRAMWSLRLLVFTTRNLITFFVKVFLSHHPAGLWSLFGFFAWSAFQKFVPKIFKCTPL